MDMKYKKQNTFIIKIVFIFLLIGSFITNSEAQEHVRVPKIDITTFSGTEADVNAEITKLETLIAEAESKNLDATKEKMAIRLAKVFLIYANWDENNKDFNKKSFESVENFHETSAEILAENLATYERSEVITVLEEAVTTLTAVISGEIIRKPVPTIDWSQISYDGNQLIHDGKPVFLADYTWQPDTAGSLSLTDYFGAYDGYYIDANFVDNAQGDIKVWVLNQLNSKPDGNFGLMFIGHKNVPNWLETKYPNIKTGGSLFTGYDIDHPGTREAMEFLLEGVIPKMKGKNYTRQGYMLSNEPHWNLAGNWAVTEFSEFGKTKFKDWLKEKHQTISTLNALWGTSFTDFDNVAIPSFPMPKSQIGTPIWYDVMRFNQVRATEWLKFLNDEVIKHDPDAKTHIKVIPEQWTDNGRWHGLDFEALTDITVNIGNDGGSFKSKRWGKIGDWPNRYSYFWESMSMSYDFFRSISPNKVNYNSEAHFIQTTAFADLFLEPSYARSVYSQTWFWPRDESGAADTRSEDVSAAVIQQPRVLNEITSTYMDLNTHSEHIAALQHNKQHIRLFYSETSAINKENYMTDTFHLYESMYFDGTAIGFATENIIKKQNNRDWEVIIVYKTEYVTEEELNALQTYLNNGGTVIVDAVSLKKDEYGKAHTISLTPGSGVLQIGSSLEDLKTRAYNVITSKGKLPLLTLDETNAVNAKGCLWKSYKDERGKHIISIVNIGKGEADLTLALRGDDTPIIATNLLTGETLSSKFKMQPEDVILLEVEKINVGDDSFTIETVGETCPDKDNGKINITAKNSGSYAVVFNNESAVNFTTETTLEDIAPGTYDLCITNTSSNVENCFNLKIGEGTLISGESSVNNNKVAVKINKGTAPYNVYVNGEALFETLSTSFLVPAIYGDVVEVKTQKACEGVFSTTVKADMVAYPNPTEGLLDIIMPIFVEKIAINVYDIHSKLVQSKTYNVNNGMVRLDLSSNSPGIYFATVQLEKPVTIKIIKR